MLSTDLVSRGLPDPDVFRVDSTLGSISSITSDGQYVAFSTNDHFELGSDGLPLPPELTGPDDSRSDLYVKDLQTGKYEHIDIIGADQNATFASISPNGRYVAWKYEPEYFLEIIGTWPVEQAYYHFVEPEYVAIYDRQTGAGSIFESESTYSQGLSVSNDGTAVFATSGFTYVRSDVHPAGYPSDYEWYIAGGVGTSTLKRFRIGETSPSAIGTSEQGAISADGRYIAHVLSGTPNIYWTSASSAESLFVGSGVNPQSGQVVSISGSGQFVAFASTGVTSVGMLTPDSVVGQAQQVYVKDMSNGQIRLVSKSQSGLLSNGDRLTVGSISDDGRFVTFVSNAQSLSGLTFPGNNVYIKDMLTGRLQLAHSALPQVFGASTPSISADGEYVAFSAVFSFTSDDHNPGADVYRVSNALADNIPPRVASPIPNQSTLEDSPFNFQVPAGTFVDDDALPGHGLSYFATLADGSFLPFWLTFNPATREFSGTPTNPTVGSLALKVTAFDAHGAQASTTFVLTVVNTNDPPLLVTPLPDASAQAQATFSYQVPQDPMPSFTDPDVGDFLQYSATLADGHPLPRWLSINPFQGRLSGYAANAMAGSFDIRVTATDSAGASVSDDFRLTITALPNPTPETVYVNSAWRVPAGTDPDGTGPATKFDYDAFSNLQFALDAVADGGTVVVYAGTYFPGGTGGPNSGPGGAAAATDDGFGLPLISNFEKTVTIDLQPAVNFGTNRRININNATLLLDEHVTLRATVDAVDGLTAHVFATGSIVLDGPSLELTGNRMPVEGESFPLLQASNSNLQGALIQGGFETELVPFATGAMQPRYRPTMDPQTFQPAAVDLVFVKPPIAKDDTYTVVENGFLHVGELGFDPAALASNDTDGNGTPIPSEPIAFVGEIVDPPDHAALFLVSSQFAFQYMPATGFSGEDHFTYRIIFNGVPSNIATVTINVTPFNRPPEAAVDAYTTNEDTEFSATSVLANDSDAHGGALGENNLPLTAELVSPPANADAFTFNPDGTFSYKPVADFNGTDSFTYLAVDSLGGKSDPVSVTINVNSVNDPPGFTLIGEHLKVLELDGLEAFEHGMWVPHLGAGPPDETWQSVEFIVTNDNEGLFQIQPSIRLGTANGFGILEFVRRAHATGVATVTVQMRDNGGTDNGGIDTSQPQTFTITIEPVNDWPWVASPLDDFTVDEDAADTELELSNTFDDIDIYTNGDTLSLSVFDNSNPALFSSLRFEGTTLIVEYAPDRNGIAEITVEAKDQDDAFVRETFTITVNPVNDKPVAQGDAFTVNEDTTLIIAARQLLENDSDADGDRLDIVDESTPQHGALTRRADGGFNYTPNSNAHGSDSFTYRVSDGIEQSQPVTVSINVLSMNDPPEPTSLSISTSEDVSASITLMAIDRDGDSLTYSVVRGPANGMLSGVAPNLTYQPADNYFGSDQFTYEVFDGLVRSLATVSILVTPVNDRPSVAGPITVVVSEDDRPATIDLLAGASDPDAPETLNVTNLTRIRGDASGISVGVNRLIVDPAAYQHLNAGQSETIEYRYDIVDSSDARVAQTVMITITGKSASGPSVTLDGRKMMIRGTARVSAPVQTALATASSLPSAAVVSGNDKIRVNALGKTAVSVSINDVSFGTFPLNAFDQIVVHALDGDDDVKIDASVTKQAIIFGAAGNDLLVAGGGNSVIVGGDGIDVLWGGSGRNVLIGGRGSDLVYGGKADDLMIAGATKFDDDLVALLAISNEWNSTRNYDLRVANLRGTGSGTRLNGTHLLTKSTVLDDSNLDLLVGSSGRDWFFANFRTPGTVIDLFDQSSKDKELADDIELM